MPNPLATGAGLSMGFESFTSSAARGCPSRADESVPADLGAILDPFPSRGAAFRVGGARPLDRHRRSLRDAHGRRYRNSGGRDRSLALEILETVHVDETGLRERLAHAVDIETELSGGKALSLLVFLLDAALRRRKHLLGLPARHRSEEHTS